MFVSGTDLDSRRTDRERIGALESQLFPMGLIVIGRLIPNDAQGVGPSCGSQTSVCEPHLLG